MQNFTQDRLIQSENLTEFNIAYPIYITGWEVRQVQDINKLYARVFYKKSVRGAKAAKVNLTCISEFGEIIQEEIKSINDIDKKAYDFFEIYPLQNDTRKIQISVIQGLSSDGTIVTETQALMVTNTFVPFGQEIESAAGQRLIASAKGYPIKMENCWICCCGAFNANSSEKCVVCESAKADVFEKITEENIKEQAATVADERKAKKEQEEKEQEAQKIKRKKRNKLIAILSACCAVAIILFCSLYFPLAPLNSVKTNGIIFEKKKIYDQEGYFVAKYTGNENYINIPSEIRGKPVIGIGYSAFYEYTNLIRIDLPNSIQYISDHAFADCKNLQTINLPNSIQYIGSYAFSGCEDLQTIDLPDQLSGIEQGTFMDCESLESIEIPDSVQYINGGDQNYWGSGAFANCINIKKMIIPASVTLLQGQIFYGWNIDQTIYFETPKELQSWANSEFNSKYVWDTGCYANIVYGYNNIQSNSQFDYVIHENNAILTKYKSTATNVTVPITIDDYNVIGIGGTFIDNNNITSITIRANLPIISNRTFLWCENLSTIILPTNLKRIDEFAFAGCSKLNNIILPEGITTIGAQAFNFCSSLENINIPSSVNEIESYAFNECRNLSKIFIPKNVTIMGYDVFSDCNKLTIYVESKDKPQGWSEYWNEEGCPVSWGYTGN